MTVRYLGGALTAIALTWGLPAVVPAQAQTRDASLLPPEVSGEVTVTGCLRRGGQHDKYLLASPRLGSVADLPEATCNATVDERALELEHTGRHGIEESMVGRWIEVVGRLEKETSNDPGNFRELYITSLRVAGIEPAKEWTPDASLLPPEESAVITIAGCLQRGGDNGEKYLLAGPRLGPIANVPEDTCRASIDTRAIELEHEGRFGMNEAMIGRWVEVNGRLEKETGSNPDNLRELHVRSFRMLPVVPPRVAVATPRPRFEPQPITPPAPPIPSQEGAVGTTGAVQTTQRTLPRTASSIPAMGLLAALSLATGLALRVYGSRERG